MFYLRNNIIYVISQCKVTEFNRIMEQKVRKVRKSRISTGSHCAVKRGRMHRFAKWVEDVHGVPFRGMYEKLRGGRSKGWEDIGISRCMDEYGFHGTPTDLWNKCVRNRFCEFMETKGMSRMTTWKKFSAGEFTELEMRGIQDIYKFWHHNVETKN